MDWMNEIDREDPIFIENEGLSLAPLTGMTGQPMGTIAHGFHPLGRMHPFANTEWVWSNRGPRPYPIPLDLAHGLVPSPNGPWPHGRTPMSRHQP